MVNYGTARDRCTSDGMFGKVKTAVAILVTVLIIIGNARVSALNCVQCTSSSLVSCETSPPTAIPCQEDKSAGVNCMIARELTSTGDQLTFIRGCTLVRVGKGCMQGPNNTDVCYETCHMDACNHGNYVHALLPNVYFYGCLTLVQWIICFK